MFIPSNKLKSLFDPLVLPFAEILNCSEWPAVFPPGRVRLHGGWGQKRKLGRNSQGRDPRNLQELQETYKKPEGEQKPQGDRRLQRGRRPRPCSAIFTTSESLTRARPNLTRRHRSRDQRDRRLCTLMLSTFNKENMKARNYRL